MAAKSPSTNPEHRVVLWGMARSLSTVFEKCMSFVDGVQIINEPFQCAATLGPEGLLQKPQGPDNYNMDTITKSLTEKLNTVDSADMEYGWDDAICTYQWVKSTLEKDFPGRKLVFSKDLITGIVGKHDMLPRGYIHTFIIRNPIKVCVSVRKQLVHMLPPGVPPDQFDMTQFPMLKMYPGFGFGEMLDLIEHLTKVGDIHSDPIIIDADDMQNHPESIVRQYCDKTGIPFNKSLLSWEAGDGIVKKNWLISKGFLQGNQMMKYFEAAFASTGFLPAKDPPSSLTPDVVKMADMVEPYYRKLYTMRIKP